ncbi:MAG: tetraacyldisaccharide 4'-kinase [Candidatus Kapabacteria bacterium]|nr:tetraacyldisaccharide 4'-kinase [Candidatus Kapabacteria bacterium]
MLKFLSKIYEYSIKRINSRFDNNETDIYKPSVPVISVGNLSLGGTGKTPFVIMLGKFLKEKNLNIGIIGKGYKRQSRGELLVSDGKEIKTTPENAGDEMFLLAQKLKAPVLIHNEKYLAAKSIESLFNLDCILLDDGFQHRKLHRNVDIVLLDDKTLRNPNLIPKGRLREPISSLNRADILCLMDINFDRYSIILSEFQDKLIIECEKKISMIYNLFNNSSLDGNSKYEFLAISGIGNPESFHQLLSKNSIIIKDKINFIDHYNYNLNSVKYIISKCNKNHINYIITTEKDAIKLKNYGELFAEHKIEFYVANLDIIIKNNKEEFFDYIMNKINK